MLFSSNEISKINLPFENDNVIKKHNFLSTLNLVTAYAVQVTGLPDLVYFNTLICATNFINQDPTNRVKAGKNTVPESWVIICL